MSSFVDYTVVVTGASSGIGFELSRLLVDAGAQVFAADLDAAGAPDGCVRIDADVALEEDVERVVSTAIDATGRIDVLCNNAGLGSTTSVVDCPTDEWDRVFAVNARGVFLGMKHVLPTMVAQGKGSIVNTASVAGLIGLPDRAAYSASKGAVISLTRQVAIQYAATGVRCNCICPGTVDSPWVGRLLQGADDPAAARAALVARQPVGRLGQPLEIAKAALYLASDDAEFVTGTALVIDGGIVAG
ncbi:MAG: SDR family oxidoreductase [Actinobacteria bacterium]|nr:SDR family oxidoreductase [Actinomycetota bacterium]